MPAVIYKPEPALRRDVAWRVCRVKPRECFGPGARSTTIILDDGGTFLASNGPPVSRGLNGPASLFKMFRMFKIRVLNILDNLNSAVLVMRVGYLS